MLASTVLYTRNIFSVFQQYFEYLMCVTLGIIEDFKYLDIDTK